jgi:hypothetical protein
MVMRLQRLALIVVMLAAVIAPAGAQQKYVDGSGRLRIARSGSA